MQYNNDYKNPYGLWKVTTEGDCEGKTTTNLGTYEGYLDDIAFGLADRCYYSLNFKKIPAKDCLIRSSKIKEVSVSLDIESKTWDGDMNSIERTKFFKEMLNGRNVSIKEGGGYACVTLVQSVADMKQAKREQALAKLTKEEKELLGIKL